MPMYIAVMSARALIRIEMNVMIRNTEKIAILNCTGPLLMSSARYVRITLSLATNSCNLYLKLDTTSGLACSFFRELYTVPIPSETCLWWFEGWIADRLFWRTFML